MQRQRIYIHRHGPRYRLYMDDANLAELASFADLVCDGDRTDAMTAEELVGRIRGCSAILSFGGGGSHEITPEVLRGTGSVRAICIAHWCGQLVDTAAAAGVPAIEGSNANTVAVAELTLAAALMGIRQPHVFDRRMKAGSSWGEPRMGVGMLKGSVVGLVGLGRIGRYLAQLLRLMGAKVIAYDIGFSPEQANQLGIALVPLDELLRTSDVVSLHLPVTDQTRGLLGQREFALLRDGCVFINSARAEIYDEPALVRELRSGRFSAFLDVFALEPLPLEHPFRRLDNVVLTPHLAGDNLAMCRRCGSEAIATLRDHFAGHGLRDRRYAFP